MYNLDERLINKIFNSLFLCLRTLTINKLVYGWLDRQERDGVRDK